MQLQNESRTLWGRTNRSNFCYRISLRVGTRDKKKTDEKLSNIASRKLCCSYCSAVIKSFQNKFYWHA